ncbi:MAG TPA: hypothetical protein VNX68_06580 [Nitrosopumilaceae archaeon]|jgi:hypothetical protein|nr:hypothetical protein [Nitrosopumilaceae archaeon]
MQYKYDKVNLGSNDDHKPGYINVDQSLPADIVHDLSIKWPFDDNSLSEIIAHDVFEHIDNPCYRGNKGKIWCFNEAYRCLKPGGILDLIVPTVDGYGAFQDPTHVSFWTPNDRFYFCAERDPITHKYKIWEERVRFGCDPKLDYERLSVIPPLQRFGGHYGITGLFGISSPGDWRHSNYIRGEKAWKVFAKLEALK